MKKTILLLALFLCLLFFACDAEIAESTQETTIETTAAITLKMAETTVETTMETTVETTAEATTAETTTVATTTATPKPAPKPKSPHVQTVLDGEYTYNDGNPPIIETIDGFTYVNGILIVNKTYPLPKDFDPGTLHPDAKAAFDTMREAAAAEGLKLRIISGYRPYSQQDSTYHNYAKRDGKELADRYSARPGHSEHQSGLAMDINSLQQSFGESPEGLWLAAHCAEYGFILRYGADKEDSTGFMYEPWHLRYLGTEIATAVQASGLSLEEYLGISSVYPTESE